MNLNQFSNLEKVDWIFCSTLNELESNEGKSEEATSKTSAAKFIGPMIPSTYLDGRIKGDKGYGASLWKPLSKECIQWLDSRPRASVVYVSFGNMLALSNAQMDEIGWGLLNSGWNFLWVVKEEDGQEDRPKENIVVVRIYSLVKETVYAGVVRKPKKGRNAAISNASQK